MASRIFFGAAGGAGGVALRASSASRLGGRGASTTTCMVERLQGYFEVGDASLWKPSATPGGVRWYCSSSPRLKIQSINSDLSQEEMEKLVDEEWQKIQDEREANLFTDWKPGQRKRPITTSHRLEDFADILDESGQPKFEWTARDKRCGALGIKVGMIPVWDEWGVRHPCTVLYLDENVVLRVKTADGPDGYDAVQLAAGERKVKRVSKPVLGQYQKFGLAERPPYIVREFRVTSPSALPEPGTRIHARHFLAGQNVDVSAISKGKGFQGGMKRHNFGGMPASHGTSKSHRSLGATGSCQDPGRVFKGKKMPGRMGSDRVTVQNLRIIKIDRGRNLLYVKGAVPGNKGGFVEIRDAVKRPLFGTDKVEGGAEASRVPPLPTFDYASLKDADDADDAVMVDGNGEAGHEVFMPLPPNDPFDPVADAA